MRKEKIGFLITSKIFSFVNITGHGALNIHDYLVLQPPSGEWTLAKRRQEFTTQA